MNQNLLCWPVYPYKMLAIQMCKRLVAFKGWEGGSSVLMPDARYDDELCSTMGINTCIRNLHIAGCRF